MRSTKSLLLLTLAIAVSLTVVRIHLGLGLFLASLFTIAIFGTLTWSVCRTWRPTYRILVTSVAVVTLLYLPLSGPLYFGVRSVHAHENPTGPTADVQKFVVNRLFGAPIGSIMRRSPWIHDSMTAYLQSWDDSGLAVHRYFNPLPETDAPITFYLTMRR